MSGSHWKGHPKGLTRAEIAECLKIDDAELDALIDEGMPHYKKDPGRFGGYAMVWAAKRNIKAVMTRDLTITFARCGHVRTMPFPEISRRFGQCGTEGLANFIANTGHTAVTFDAACPDCRRDRKFR